MREGIKQLLALPGVVGRVWSLPYGSGLRRSILASHLDMTFFRRQGTGGKAMRVCGCSVRYCSFASFVSIFREIFLGAEYCFTPKSDQPFIIDCGANIGLATLYFKLRFPKAEIVAFEPDENAYRCLGENIAANSLGGVTVHNKAVAGREGELDFWRSAGNPGAAGNTTRPSSSRERTKVGAVKLSGYFDRRVDLLKLDVEGAEQEVLEELAASGKLALVDQMFIEYHHHLEGEESKDVLSGTLALLEASGFGYQVGGQLRRPFKGRTFQGLSIYAYNKLYN